MIKAITTCIYKMLPKGLPENEDDHFGYLIGNSNTGKLHQYGCRAIDMMKEEHKVETDGFVFENCGWCHGGSDSENNQSYLDHFHEKKKIAAAKTSDVSVMEISVDITDPEDIVICRDERVLKFFKDKICVNCDSRDGIVKMYPTEHGVRLLCDLYKRYWIYKECSHCGYQTSLKKIKPKN